MINVLENIPETDPLAQAEQRAIIDTIIQQNVDKPGAPMVVLNAIQNEIGYISEPMQAYIAQALNMPVARIHGVVSFYSFFSTTPRGKHTLKICLGTACYVGGAPQLIDKAQHLLGVNVGETTGDWTITLDTCRCVGACSQAPVITVDDDIYGRVTPNKLAKIIKKYQ